MIRYRPFNNFDPPSIADLWNECFVGRGSYPLRYNTFLERWVFSKPYFDPAGLTVALDDDKVVGFIHSGFGPNDDESALDTRNGVVCAVAVKPSHRRQGIASELLRRAEEYLRGRGATTLYAGPGRPMTPFYFGLYGGSDVPGFLTSDAAAGPFFENHGYKGWSTALVFQRRLDRAVSVTDSRFSAIRRRYEVRMLPRTAVGTWWSECVLGLLEPIEFRLEEKPSGLPAARVLVWEMEGYSWRWNAPAAGIMDVQTRPDIRRQGLTKYLLFQILRYLQENYFSVCEIHAAERNPAAVGLSRSLGFDCVDAGRVYRRDPTGSPAIPGEPEPRSGAGH